MPRRSAEDRAAAYYRHGGKGPPPPRDLSAFCKRLWRDIVVARPPEFFPPGQQELLRQFCELAEMRRFFIDMWELDKLSQDYMRAIVQLSGQINATGTKLRMTNSSAIDKRAGILSEKEIDVRSDDDVIKADVLFGGGKTRF
jgi:hypothetical protein